MHQRPEQVYPIIQSGLDAHISLEKMFRAAFQLQGAEALFWDEMVAASGVKTA